MSELAQGLVLMLAGMTIVFSFLLLLIGVTNATCKPLAAFNSILGQDAPTKAPAKAAASADADVALAIAVAMG